MDNAFDVMFVCTGNICRSPMAEFCFRDKVMTNDAWRVSSAGIMAMFGRPSSRFAVQAMLELDVNVEPHRSRPLTPDLVGTSRLLVVMTQTHREQLLTQYPAAESRIRLLKSFDPEAEGEDVMDPIGLSLDVYRHVRDEIVAALPGVDAYLKSLTQDDDGGKEYR